jgi:hypothetical protein
MAAVRRVLRGTKRAGSNISALNERAAALKNACGRNGVNMVLFGGAGTGTGLSEVGVGEDIAKAALARSAKW